MTILKYKKFLYYTNSDSNIDHCNVLDIYIYGRQIYIIKMIYTYMVDRYI